MIKFLQKLRQKSITENRLSKYLLYAFGEIILIVIGILVALGIDSWYSHKSEIENLIKSYEQIEETLITDLANIDEIIDYQTNAAESAKKARKHLKSRKKWTLELSDWITDADNLKIYTPQSSAYGAIKRNGIELIENIFLKDQLIRVYEELKEDHKRRESIVEYIRNNYYNVWETRNLDRDDSLDWKVIDYDAVLNDFEFHGNLLALINRHRTLVKTATELSVQIKSLQEHIKDEISRLEKGGKLPEINKHLYFSNDGIILKGGRMRLGIDYGVDTSEHIKNWASFVDDVFCISYPAGEDNGIVFITTGRPASPPRQSENFSKYKKLFIKMKGDLGGEKVEIALKDKFDPTDGSEDKIELTLTNQWKIYEIDIASNFASADLEQLYIVTSFVFKTEAQNIYVEEVYFE
tara:strand:- start:460 stop:1686 length:1227 start_codon:yes stop_codon:yes gene_type:complete